MVQTWREGVADVSHTLQINIQKALETMPDIPESTTVSLLKLVVTAASTGPSSSTALPQMAPALAAFLTSFVESPSTPATLRAALQSHLTAIEVLPVLKVLDDWLGWWAKRGGGGGEMNEGRKDWKSEGGKRPKRLPTNPFLALVDGVSTEEGRAPPRVEDVSSVRVCRDFGADSLFLRLSRWSKRFSTLTSSPSFSNAHPTPSCDDSPPTSPPTSLSPPTCPRCSARCPSSPAPRRR